MSKQIEVSKVVLKINGKEISLTLEEAKELRDILDGAFPKPPVTVTRVEREWYLVYPTVINPVITYGPITTWRAWDVQCAGNVGGATLCCANQTI